MDSDDTISPENGRKLRALVEREEDPRILGYVVQVHSPGPGADGDLDMTVVDHVKLFRNLPQLRFEHRIHEQIIPAINRAGGQTAWTDIFVVHSGYDHSPEGQERKKQRDLKLLHLELEEQPQHPFTLFNLGMTYADIGEWGRAIEFLERCLRHSGEVESHVRKVYALLVSCHARTGHAAEARAVCERGLRRFPEDTEIRFRQAMLLHESGRLAEAVAAYLKILHDPPERYFTSVDRGIYGFKTRHNLAVVYGDQGDWSRAEEQWRLVVQEAPRYQPGWRRLGEVLLRRGKAAEATALAKQLISDPRCAPRDCSSWPEWPQPMVRLGTPNASTGKPPPRGPTTSICWTCCVGSCSSRASPWRPKCHSRSWYAGNRRMRRLTITWDPCMRSVATSRRRWLPSAGQWRFDRTRRAPGSVWATPCATVARCRKRSRRGRRPLASTRAIRMRQTR